MEFVIGDTVRILPPFGETYTGEYKIIDIDENGVVFLENVEGAFDPIYLETI